MALINCRECKKEISRTVRACPQCGAKSPDINKYEEEIRIIKLLKIAAIVILLIVVVAIVSPHNNYSTEIARNNHDSISQQTNSSASFDFIKSNPELGELISPYVQDTDDWAQGKRQWVTTNKGSYLFYLKNNEVITIYLSDKHADGGKREIWRKKTSDNNVADTHQTDNPANSNQSEVQWGLYQPTLKQEIETMFIENDCNNLKNIFNHAFEIQQSGAAHNPHVALVAYIAEKRSGAGCHN